MADKTTEILEFKIEQGDAISELERTKKSIIGLKQEQKDLNKAYKDGNITLDEYASDSVRLEQILRKESRTYVDLTKSVTGTKTGMDRLIDSNNRLADSVKKQNSNFTEFSKNVNVGGQSLEGVTTKITSFLTPAAAAAGAVSALGALYISSAAGARDLESAQTQLTTSVTIMSNSLAKLLGADGKGGGLLSQFAFEFNSRVFGTFTAVQGRIAAIAQQTLKELELLDIDSKRFAKTQLDLAEEQRRIRDDQTKSEEERLWAASAVQGFIDEREKRLVETQEKRLNQIRILRSVDVENIELKKQEKIIELEIADILEDSQGKRTEAINGILNLEKEKTAERQKALDLLRKEEEAEDKRVKVYIDNLRKTSISTQAANAEADKIEKDSQITRLKNVSDVFKQEVDINASFNRKLNADRKKFREEDKKNAAERNEALRQLRQDEIDGAMQLTSEIGRLGNESNEIQKGVVLAQLAIDTAAALSSLTRNSEANPANAVSGGAAGALQFAAGVVRIFANVNEARKLLGGGSGGSAPPQTFTSSGKTYKIVNGQAVAVDQGTSFKGLLFGEDEKLSFDDFSLGSSLRRGKRIFKSLFAEGGYTGDGAKNDPAGIVHKGEVVWSQSDVAAVGGAQVANAMRPTYKGYQDGGIVTESMTSSMDQNMILANALRNMPAPVLDYAEFTNFSRRVQYKEKITSK
jgi:uncharacterized protein YoxC